MLLLGTLAEQGITVESEAKPCAVLPTQCLIRSRPNRSGVPGVRGSRGLPVSEAGSRRL